MFVLMGMDPENAVLGRLRGDGSQEDRRLPCLRERGLIVHDGLFHGLRVYSLPDRERGKHGMLLKRIRTCAMLASPRTWWLGLGMIAFLRALVDGTDAGLTNRECSQIDRPKLHNSLIFNEVIG
jgi:hypothetical protein